MNVLKQIERSLEMTAPKKRMYEEAFERRKLTCVKVGDFYADHTIFKVLEDTNQSCYPGLDYPIRTTEKLEFSYGHSCIVGTATSATTYTSEKKATKTELIELFSNLSLNDIWCATFYTLDKDSGWQEEIVEKIQSMDKDSALKFVKSDFTTFGKTTRELIGQKIQLKSDNNYYTVRDLSIHFDGLAKGKSPTEAAKKSIRKLDVNTLQCLIFNSVKYLLK